MEKIHPKEASEQILVSKFCKKLLLKRLYMIIGNRLSLSDQETPDKTPEHYTDVEFHEQSKYRVHSCQFPAIPDTISYSRSETQRLMCNNKSRTNGREASYACEKDSISAVFPWGLEEHLQINKQELFFIQS